MAITVTNRGWNDAASNWQETATLASFTPADGSLLVAVALCGDPSGSGPGTLTVSGGGLTWTKRAEYKDAISYGAALSIWTAPVSTGASTSVVATHTPNSDTAFIVIACAELSSDYNAFEQAFSDNFAGNSGTGGSYADDFGSALDGSDSVKLVASYSYDDNENFVAGTGWTELVNIDPADIQGVHSPNLLFQYDQGTTDTGVDIDFIPGGHTSYQQIVLGVEISAAGGAASITSTGAIAAPVPTLSGSSIRTVAASGAINASTPILVGTATRRVPTSGAILGTVPTLAGSATVGAVITSSGAISAPVPQISGSAVRRVVGSAAISAPVPSIAAAAIRTVVGSGAISATTPLLAGTALRTIIGSGAITAPVPTLSATGVRTVQAAGAIESTVPVLAGTAAIEGIVGSAGAIEATVPQIGGTATVIKNLYPGGTLLRRRRRI